MLKLIYHCFLTLGFFLYLPKWVLYKIKDKNYNLLLGERLGFKMPNFSFTNQQKPIWIHAPSVGEMKAVIPLIKKIQQQYTHLALVVSAFTDTGLKVAKQSLSGIHSYFILPMDFSWSIKRLLNKLQPHLLILVEGDFWYNLISLAPNVVVVNAKISESSYKKLRFFSRYLFDPISLFCTQNHEYARRFQQLGIAQEKIVTTGNLKFDYDLSTMSQIDWEKELGIQKNHLVITVASTHANEEEFILNALEPFWNQGSDLKVLIAPRHPHRFDEVAYLLEKKNLKFHRLSQKGTSDSPKVILMDRMGMLSPCFERSNCAILGGSFIPQIGGHNIFEPIAFGIPVIFGPFMHKQKELVKLILEAKAGYQTDLNNLSSIIQKLLLSSKETNQKAGFTLRDQIQGSTQRTLKALESYLNNSDKKFSL